MMEAGTVMIFLLPCRWFGTAGVQRGGTGAGEGLVLPDGMTCGLHTRNDGGGAVQTFPVYFQVSVSYGE